jgi:predicted nucleotide-binding protein
LVALPHWQERQPEVPVPTRNDVKEDAVTDPTPIKVLVASSTEARTVARDLRTRLPEHWSTALWDEGVIKPGQGAWTGLIEVCRGADVVVLLLTADDVLEHRGQRVAVPRDNVVFEAGLCMGLLGPERTLLVQQQDLELRLPSDLAGITRVRFPAPVGGQDPRAALDSAAREIERSIVRLGPRLTDVAPSADHRQALADELDRLCRAATARGWEVDKETSSVVTLRYTGRRPVEVRLGLGEPERARQELREVAFVLHKLGVRVGQDLLPARARAAAN